MLERIVQKATERPTLNLGEHIRAEVEARLRAEGVPEEVLNFLSAVQRERALLRSTDLARRLFPIQELPPGAVPFYEHVAEEATVGDVESGEQDVDP